MLDESIGDITESEGLSCSCCHLDQCSRTIVRKRGFEIFDRFYLYLSESSFIEWRKSSEKCKWLLRKPHIVTKCLGSMECKNLSTSRIRLEIIRKSSFDARGFISEWKWILVGIYPIWYTIEIFCRLYFNSSKSRSFLFSFNNSYRFPINIEKIVGKSISSLQWKFSHCHTKRSNNIQIFHILNNPPSRFKKGVYVFSSLFFRIEAHLLENTEFINCKIVYINARKSKEEGIGYMTTELLFLDSPKIASKKSLLFSKRDLLRIKWWRCRGLNPGPWP